jgi:aspartate/methionine/tyrosine aminotransferase
MGQRFILSHDQRERFAHQDFRASARRSGKEDTIFSQRLMRKAGVAGVAGPVFYPNATKNPKSLRLTLSKSQATVEEAARRLGTMADRLLTTSA